MDVSQKKIFPIIALPAMLALAGCLSDTLPVEEGSAPAPGPTTNSAPQISGTPPQAVVIGSPYDFTPTASDADNDPLTFSIANQPNWASFDSSTGRVSGTPTLGDVGLWNGISISVTDGIATASLPEFTVDVMQIGTASTTLSWTAPTLNNDGTPLVDLIGYKIYYGLAPNSYTETITIQDPGTTTYVVENLAPATYYFVATSVRAGGVESDMSNIAEITVN